MTNGWTDERVDILKKLWVDGLSAAQIAGRLGNVTRNAVIGKVHRLGLAGRNTPSAPARRTANLVSSPLPPLPEIAPEIVAETVPVAQLAASMPAEAQRQAPAAGARPAPVAAAAAARPMAAASANDDAQPMGSRPTGMTPRAPRDISAGLVDVHHLGHGMCKWPIGDPGDADFGFCGSRSEGTAVYCAEHAAIAYTQPINQRRLNNKVASL